MGVMTLEVLHFSTDRPFSHFIVRFALAFGAVPVLIAFPWRLAMHETETYQRVTEERQRERECAIDVYAQAATASTPLSANNNSHGNYGTNSTHNNSTYAGDPQQYSRETQNILSDQRYGTSNNTSNTSSAVNKTGAKDNNDSNKRSSTGAWIGNGPGIQNLQKFRHERKNNNNKNNNGAGANNNPGEVEMHMVTDCIVQDNSMLSLSGDVPLDYSDNMRSSDYAAPYTAPVYMKPTLTEAQIRAKIQKECGEVTRLQEIQKAIKYYKWHMLGTSLCWFLLDVDFYANGLFNHEITSSIFSTPGQQNSALQDAFYTLILSIIAMPGYYLSVMYIDTVGRKNLQMLGFTMMGVLFLICSVSYEWLMDPLGGSGRKYLFLMIYALTFLFR